MINLNLDIPNWTDILQAFAALIAVPLTLVTLYQLVKKDKKRESEIKSLSTIANQLTGMQVENEKRFKSSKKPLIEFHLTSKPDKRNKLQIKFTNKNTNCTIAEFKLNNDLNDFKEFTATFSTINTQAGIQSFFIYLSSKSDQIDNALLKIEYTTEEGYEFVQDLEIIFDNNNYNFLPGAIIDKGMKHNKNASW